MGRWGWCRVGVLGRVDAWGGVRPCVSTEQREGDKKRFLDVRNQVAETSLAD